jgi:hypothetical protein
VDIYLEELEEMVDISSLHPHSDIAVMRSTQQNYHCFASASIEKWNDAHADRDSKYDDPWQ